jgi:outer membrane lipoprotein-sorting protein
LRFSLLLIFTVAGCATMKAPGDEVPAPEAQGRALLAAWLERGAAVQSLQGLAKVKVKSGQGSMSGTQVLLAARPDRLRAETLSPFGTPLLSLATDGRQLTVLFPGDNLFLTGEATMANLARFTRVPLAPAALVDILLWQPPLIAFEELAAFRTADGGWRLLLLAGSLRQELVFDGLERLQSARYFAGAAPQLLITYGDLTATEVPRRIQLEQPPFALQASLDFSELALNQPLPSERFVLKAPPGSRVVPLARLDETDAPPDAVVPGLNGR